MNTTVWTGPDWASIPAGSEIVFPDGGEPVWRACTDDAFKPLYRSMTVRTGVIHPLPGQLGGGDLGDENDAKPHTPTYDWPFRETPGDVMRRSLLEDPTGKRPIKSHLSAESVDRASREFGEGCP